MLKDGLEGHVIRLFVPGGARIEGDASLTLQRELLLVHVSVPGVEMIAV